MISPVYWFRKRRWDRNVRRVKTILGALIDAPDGLSCFDVAARTGFSVGRAMNWLAIAEHREFPLIESRWARGPYPRRRLYALTAEGRRYAGSWGILPGGVR